MYKVNETKGKGIACWVLCFLIVLMAVSSMALCVSAVEVEKESAVSAEREETESNSGADNKVQEVERESIGESAVSAEREETESNSGADAESVNEVLYWSFLFLCIMFGLVFLGLMVTLP